MDKYDEAIEFLSKHPERIEDSWNTEYNDETSLEWVNGQPLPKSFTNSVNQAHCLFYRVCPSGTFSCGCLTQIRKNPNIHKAWTEELTNEIAADERIPKNSNEIKVTDLQVFAEWQRKIDIELCR